MPKQYRAFAVAVALVAVLVPSAAFASHSWAGYHWGRTSNPVTLKIHDNVNSAWQTYFDTAVSQWNSSAVINLTVQGAVSSPKQCTSTTGQIEVCNAAYGQRGWLGIAGISISGSHITKAYTKLNDSYFGSGSSYNTPAWRAMVTCQEIGHDFGLDHQDETFDNVNLGTCMDYTNDPDGGAGGASNNDPANTAPNSHDYAELSTIYQHLDNVNTWTLEYVSDEASRVTNGDETENLVDENWGAAVRWDALGRPDLFVRVNGMNQDGELEYEMTHVTWTKEARPGREKPGTVEYE